MPARASLCRRNPARRLSRILAVGAMAAATAVPLATHAASPPITSAVITSAATRLSEVALTFDDGPSPYTPQILSILRQYHAHATFFVVGEYAALYAPYLREALHDGNELGNHTFTHANLQGLSDGGVAGELQTTQEAVHAATGYTPEWFRPPYGAVDGRVSGIAASLGLRTVTWSVDPRDWALPGSGAIVATVIANLRPGAIVIMHDGGGNRSETVAALAAILQAIAARHLQAVTMSRLFGVTPQPACSPKDPLARFSREGIPAHPTRRIFRAWTEYLCQGVNLGPATSRRYLIHHGLRAQDFALTGHRIIFNTRTDSVHVEVVWSWLIHAFSARGIQPRWGWAITKAWFTEYLHFHDWGAALSPIAVRHGVSTQRFELGTADSRGGEVRWEPGK